MKMHKSNYAKVVAGLVVAMGTIAGVSSAQAEVLDFEDAVSAPKNPYVSPSGDFSIQQFHNYTNVLPAKDPLGVNFNRSAQFNGLTNNYLTMDHGTDGAAIITSTTPSGVFDVFSIELGSSQARKYVNVTVVALDTEGYVIKSVTFNDQERLTAHALEGFVKMTSLEITSVLSNDTTNEDSFSFDNIHITPSILTDTFSCLSFDAPMGNGPVKVKKNRALPNKGALVDAEGILITDLDIDSPPVIVIDYYSNGSAEGTDVTEDALSAGSATEGNQFFLNDDNKWQYNLLTKRYSAAGTYVAKMVSGDANEYLISPTCESSFVIR